VIIFLLDFGSLSCLSPFSRHHRHHNFGYPSYKRPPAATSSSPQGRKDNMYINKCRTSGYAGACQQGERHLHRKDERGGGARREVGAESKNEEKRPGPSNPFVVRIIKTWGDTKTTRVKESGENSTERCRKQHTKRPPNAERTETKKKKKKNRRSFRPRTR